MGTAAERRAKYRALLSSHVLHLEGSGGGGGGAAVAVRVVPRAVAPQLDLKAIVESSLSYYSFKR